MAEVFIEYFVYSWSLIQGCHLCSVISFFLFMLIDHCKLLVWLKPRQKEVSNGIMIEIYGQKCK